MPETHEIIIVGAGLSGLSVAHFLHTSAPELDILILEQDGRPGGAVRSFKEQGYLAEWGPHGFLDNNPASRALLSETGLDRIAQKAPLGSFVRYVCHEGRLVQLPQSPPALLTTPLLSPWESYGCWAIFSKNRRPKSKASANGRHTASELKSCPWWMRRSPAPLPGIMNVSVSMA